SSGCKCQSSAVRASFRPALKAFVPHDKRYLQRLLRSRVKLMPCSAAKQKKPESSLRIRKRIDAMPRGDKSSYTDKQQRKAEHIEQSYEERGVASKEAEARAWATVNKQSGG